MEFIRQVQKKKALKRKYQSTFIYFTSVIRKYLLNDFNLSCHEGLAIYWNKQENYHKYFQDIFIYLLRCDNILDADFGILVPKSVLPCLGFLWCIPPSLKMLILSLPLYGFEQGEKNRACYCESRVFLKTYTLPLGTCSQILKKYSGKIELAADCL